MSLQILICKTMVTTLSISQEFSEDYMSYCKENTELSKRANSKKKKEAIMVAIS